MLKKQKSASPYNVLFQKLIINFLKTNGFKLSLLLPGTAEQFGTPTCWLENPEYRPDAPNSS